MQKCEIKRPKKKIKRDLNVILDTLDLEKKTKNKIGIKMVI
jgi:hypothetical protein